MFNVLFLKIKSCTCEISRSFYRICSSLQVQIQTTKWLIFMKRQKLSLQSYPRRCSGNTSIVESPCKFIDFDMLNALKLDHIF